MDREIIPNKLEQDVVFTCKLCKQEFSYTPEHSTYFFIIGHDNIVEHHFDINGRHDHQCPVMDKAIELSKV